MKMELDPKFLSGISKRGTRSIRSRLRNKGGAFRSAIWSHFDTKTSKYPGRQSVMLYFWPDQELLL